MSPKIEGRPMTRRLHIAIDMDDVIVDFIGGLLAAVKKEYDFEIPDEAVREWDLHPVLDPVIGRSWWAWLREREWLWANFPAVDGAIGSIERLHRQGHYIEIITSKPEWARHNVWKWLGKWRPAVHSVTIVDVDAPKVHFTTADILIDDKPANCQGFIDEGRRAILLSRPHNRSIKVKAPMQRADTWREVMLLIEGDDDDR